MSGQPHKCLDPFRAAPNIVLRRRKLFYALPKADRQHRLACAFREELLGQARDTLGDSTGFQMVYKFLEVPVCRQAFIMLTGIHADTLQHARQRAMDRTVALVSVNQTVWVSRRPLAYMDARAWLLDYAQTHGDTSPLCNKIFLPAGRKQFFMPPTSGTARRGMSPQSRWRV